jgi:hypothetical protein
MMKVRMVHQRTGGRYDGQAWPERGGVLDVPDEEAADLIRQGAAEAAGDAPAAESTGPDDGGFLPAAPAPKPRAAKPKPAAAG